MYKHYAVLKDGVVVEYPVDPRTWVVLANSYNIPEYWEGGELDGKTYVFCHNKPPNHNYDETLVEKTPALNPENGLWYRQYDVVKLDAEALSELREAAQLGVDILQKRLLSEMEAIANTIVELSAMEQEKWQRYKNDLLNLHVQPDYPFFYITPTRPDELDDLKMKVTRV
jgi:hypothetical protein